MPMRCRLGAPEEPSHSTQALFMSPEKAAAAACRGDASTLPIKQGGRAGADALPLLCSVSVSVAHSGVHAEREKKKREKKKKRKSANKTTINANMGENPAPQPWPAEICFKSNPRHTRLFFTATGRGNTPRCSYYLQELSIPN